MRIPRIFTSLPLQIGCEFDLEKEPVRHLLHVLRMKQGASLIMFNGDGRDYNGQLIDCTRKSARVAISDRSEEEPHPVLQINLGLGLSKGERMDFAVQKSVELGVTSITPLITEHSVVRLSAERMENRREHWRRVAIAACEQSGRRTVPAVDAPVSLNDWLLKSPPPGAACILLNHHSTVTLNRLTCASSEINLLVGPEGGLSPCEIAATQAAGFEGVRIGPRVMRTETAPLAAISAIQMLWGDFRT
ncbi:MAG: 16S rRNA (uracil(1498)-N(3))-methyltransferase [Gammaproteobacteria bacterium]|nr:16S rRNA (uracil(1498)-N(3))-methyltransferase [Gammaproteobacteria bacterium]